MKLYQREALEAKLRELVDRLRSANADAEKRGEEYANRPEMASRYIAGVFTANDAKEAVQLGTLQSIVDSVAAELNAITCVYVAPKRRRAA